MLLSLGSRVPHDDNAAMSAAGFISIRQSHGEALPAIGGLAIGLAWAWAMGATARQGLARHRNATRQAPALLPHHECHFATARVARRGSGGTCTTGVGGLASLVYRECLSFVFFRLSLHRFVCVIPFALGNVTFLCSVFFCSCFRESLQQAFGCCLTSLAGSLSQDRRAGQSGMSRCGVLIAGGFNIYCMDHGTCAIPRWFHGVE